MNSPTQMLNALHEMYNKTEHSTVDMWGNETQKEEKTRQDELTKALPRIKREANDVLNVILWVLSKHGSDEAFAGDIALLERLANSVRRAIMLGLAINVNMVALTVSSKLAKIRNTFPKGSAKYEEMNNKLNELERYA